MLNEELLRIVVKRIERDPDLWNQHDWAFLHRVSERTGELWPVDAEDAGLPEVEVADDGYFRGSIRQGTPMLALSEGTEASCGTAMCLAGHTVLEAGDTLLFDKEEYCAFLCKDQKGNLHRIPFRAAELLGISPVQANALFAADAGNDNLDEFKALITKVTGVTFD